MKPGWETCGMGMGNRLGEILSFVKSEGSKKWVKTEQGWVTLGMRLRPGLLDEG